MQPFLVAPPARHGVLRAPFFVYRGTCMDHDVGNQHQLGSMKTINLLRAFSSGGFADINKLNAWNMDFVQNTPEGSKYREMASKIEDTLRFMKVRVDQDQRIGIQHVSSVGTMV